MLNKISIFNINIDCFTTDALNDRILKAVNKKEHIRITNVNVHAINIALTTPRFKNTINNSEYCFCDGQGVIWAARFLGKNIPERITYAEWLPKLATYCAKHSITIFLLGSKKGIAEQAANELQKTAKSLKIVGTHNGFFNKENNSIENKKIIEKINNTSPHILLVCFGMPSQEYWIEENWSKINSNVVLNGGAALDYIAGEIKRPPAWMTNNGLEWLGRMLIEPRRLWKRYIIGNTIFSVRLMKEWIKQK